MEKYNVQYFDIETGAAAATVAEYGITLNKVATELLQEWRYAKIGFDKEKKLIVIKPHNVEESSIGSITLNRKNKQYLRINSRDFVRTVAHYCNVTLQETGKYLVEWDDEEKVLIINLNNKIEYRKRKNNKAGM